MVAYKLGGSHCTPVRVPAGLSFTFSHLPMPICTKNTQPTCEFAIFGGRVAVKSFPFAESVIIREKSCYIRYGAMIC